ncbi:MAG: glycosyltransferase family 2 protein [Proteobacteria bacterium]|nr:glycosyltransferase family 2 protein [Pseudomonadota bacterium]MBU4011198.1 glycosyltransferase family 2 protein [Pseudomonadota bacterium]
MSVSESQLTHDLDHPLVSIVVNNYNNEQYLESCLDALLAQTYRHIEIVVVDAFSSDGSRLLIDSYAERDSRIKKIYCDSYVKYPAITYNIGFLNCNGNYIAINDPDDISMPGRIEAQANYLLTNPAVGAVGCNCYEFNDDFNNLVETTVEKNVLNAAPPVRNPCLMFRKEVLAAHGMWRWQCEYAADFDWLYRWYVGGVCFYMLPEPYVRYRKAHNANISITRGINQTAKLALFRTFYGIRLFKKVGFKWWYVTLFTYAYLCSRLIKSAPGWFLEKCLKR